MRRRRRRRAAAQGRRATTPGETAPQTQWLAPARAEAPTRWRAPRAAVWRATRCVEAPWGRALRKATLARLEKQTPRHAGRRTGGGKTRAPQRSRRHEGVPRSTAARADAAAARRGGALAARPALVPAARRREGRCTASRPPGTRLSTGTCLQHALGRKAQRCDGHTSTKKSSATCCMVRAWCTVARGACESIAESAREQASVQLLHASGSPARRVLRRRWWG
jgi:hypothetical protein